jgi:hypothetical protein
MGEASTFLAHHSSPITLHPLPKKTPRHFRTAGLFIICIDSSDRLPATATTAAATTTARTARTAATAAATTTATLTFLRFIDAQRTTTHVLAIQGLDGALCIGAGHLDKAKATRTTRFAIVDQRDGLDSAVLFEQLTDLSFVGRKRQVTHIDFRHTNSLSLKKPRARSFSKDESSLRGLVTQGLRTASSKNKASR